MKQPPGFEGKKDDWLGEEIIGGSILQLSWRGVGGKEERKEDRWEEPFISSLPFTETLRNQFSYDLYNKQQSVRYTAFTDLTAYCLQIVLFVRYELSLHM